MVKSQGSVCGKGSYKHLYSNVEKFGYISKFLKIVRYRDEIIHLIVSFDTNSLIFISNFNIYFNPICLKYHLNVINIKAFMRCLYAYTLCMCVYIYMCVCVIYTNIYICFKLLKSMYILHLQRISIGTSHAVIAQ